MLGVAVAALLLSSTGVVARADQAESATRYVLVLYQYDPTTPTTIQASRGLHLRLEQPRVVILSEYLDHSRSAGTHGARDLARWYAAKYAGQRVDAIVAVGGETLQFLLEARQELWSDVPIVFCAVIDNLGGPGRLPAGVTGVTVRFPVKEDLELALRLLPKTRRVAFLSGASPADRAMARMFWDAIEPYRGRLEVTDLTGMTYEEARDRLAALPEDTVAFGISMLRDGSGRQLPGPTITQLLSARSRAPLFAVPDTVLGHGVVGGWLVSYEEIGREAAAVVQRVLDGQSPESIPVARSAAVHLAFDARELERWAIARDRLPGGSEVLFNPTPPLLTRPKTLFALAAALGIEAGLVAMLLVERRRRRLSEREARESRARIAHMNRVAVVGELTATLAHEVNTPLAAMLNDARAARRFLEAPGGRLAEARASLNAVEEQGQRARDVLLQMRRALRKPSDVVAAADLSQAIRDAVRLVQSDAREHGVALEAAFPSPGPEVACDPVQLQQILINLLLNAVDAVRGQPPERCRVRIHAQVGEDNAEVVVRDWGKGVSAEVAPRLFEPFYTSKPDGLGMGLSISRSIVEAHGGRISLLPTGEVGAAFQFFLPLASAAPAHAPALRIV